MPWTKVGRRIVGATGLLALGIGGFGIRASAQEQDACANLTRLAVLGSASGARAVVSAPGRSIVEEVDTSLPGAQAALDSVTGSRAWAGAPFVPVAAENAGYAGVSPNQIPVFATTEYPAAPQASNSTPGSSVTAKSDAMSSTARADIGGVSTDQAGVGRSVATAGAACATDASLQALADTSTDMTSVQSVLRIGSVHSHALIQTDPTGTIKKLEGTMAVEGVFVLGQAAAITDKGLVVGSSAVALPGNPLADALKAAGITLRYVAADANRETGEVTAPGLEVSVTEPVPGGDPVTTTYALGRAYARIAQTPGDAPVSESTAVDPDPGSAPVADVPGVEAATLPAATPTAPAPSQAPKTRVRRGDGQLLATAQIGSWSIFPAYAALGVGTVLLIGWVLFEMIAVRSRWR